MSLVKAAQGYDLPKRKTSLVRKAIESMFPKEQPRREIPKFRLRSDYAMAPERPADLSRRKSG